MQHLFAPLLFVAVCCACATPRTDILRVVAADGRLYYAQKDRYMISESGGFIMFKDLITGEPIRLKNGSYVAVAADPREVGEAQQRYMDDPSTMPNVDYLPEDAKSKG